MGEGGRSKSPKCKHHVNEIPKILKMRKPLFELLRIKWMVNKIRVANKVVQETRLFSTLSIGEAKAGTFFTNTNTNKQKV